MDINKDNIEKKLRDAFEPTYLNVEDCSSGCGLKFDTTIVSSKFEGKQLLARQRLVNDLFKEEMTKIHAFSQKTYTPDEWERKQKKEAAAATPEVKESSACLGGCGNGQK